MMKDIVYNPEFKEMVIYQGKQILPQNRQINHLLNENHGGESSGQESSSGGNGNDGK
uniref:Spore germination protein n=1 Tax=Meloidogyne hapla TaxID=6305 RepID=A0A1I8BTI3_MELHA